MHTNRKHLGGSELIILHDKKLEEGKETYQSSVTTHPLISHFSLHFCFLLLVKKLVKVRAEEEEPLKKTMPLLPH